MVNKNYARGRRKEYKLCDLLKKEGYVIVQRTAGSHSPFDIIAIDKFNRIIKLVQSKPDNFSKKEFQKLNEIYDWLAGSFEVQFEVR